MTSPGPGWYPSPDGNGDRWWDGSQWTASGPPPPSSTPSAGKRNWPFFTALGVIALAAVWLLATDRDPGQSIRGTFTINELIDPSPSCTGEGGYSDIREGVEVLLKDGEGKTLATSALGPGRPTGGVESVAVCQFSFVPTEVPKADFYAVSVGRRGDQTFSHQEMVEAGWTVTLSLGDF